MPITLTTAVDPGDLEAGTYGEVKIVAFKVYPVAKKIELIAHHGNTVGGDWVSADALIPGLTHNSYVIVGTDYDTLVAATSAAASEVYYDEVARELYEYLIAQGYFVGTVT